MILAVLLTICPGRNVQLPFVLLMWTIGCVVMFWRNESKVAQILADRRESVILVYNSFQGAANVDRMIAVGLIVYDITRRKKKIDTRLCRVFDMALNEHAVK